MKIKILIVLFFVSFKSLAQRNVHNEVFVLPSIFTSSIWDSVAIYSEKVKSSGLPTNGLRLEEFTSVFGRYFLFQDYYRIPVFDSIKELQNFISINRLVSEETYPKLVSVEFGNEFFDKEIKDVAWSETLNKAIDTLIVRKFNAINGDYVMYYSPVYEDSTGSWKKDVPYAHFSILDSLANGEMTLFQPNGDTMLLGEYAFGKRIGIWKLNSVTQRGVTNCEVEYNNGELNGDYLFFLNGKVIVKGSLLEGKPVKDFHFFYPNGQLKYSLELLTEYVQVEYDKNLIVLNHVLNTEQYKEFYSPYFIGIKSEPMINLIIDTDGYSLSRLNGEFKSYHENGQLCFQINFINGQIDQKELSTYYSNGSLYKHWVFNKRKVYVYSLEGELIRMSKWKKGDRHLFRG